MEERLYWCALNTLFGNHPALGIELTESCGGVEGIFKREIAELHQMAGQIVPELEKRDEALQKAKAQLEMLTAKNYSFIGINEIAYPPLLRECFDAPLGIYTSFPYDKLESLPWMDAKRKSIAIVGTRDVSSYGREWCTRIVEALSNSEEKPLIVSGLALGTDCIAHESALRFGLPTIGVMATGISDSIYPAANRHLAKKMTETEFCGLITDYPPDSPPVRENFVRRNRIIAGLCDATILIESKIRGGGLITVKYANDYSRDVYALPGNIDALRSQGCNMVIAKDMATMIDSIPSLLSKLGFKAGIAVRNVRISEEMQRQYSPETVELLRSVLALISQNRDITVAEISPIIGLTFKSTSALVGILECEGLVTSDIMGRYTISR